jgi:DNA-directed RNA polymerase subunit beta'
VLKTYNLPVGAHISVSEGDNVKTGHILVKIPRAVGKSGDITGGLPRVTELFEARNPSNPAVVSEIDGEVSFGKIKRGNREIIITSKTGQLRNILYHFRSRYLYKKMIMFVQVFHYLMVLLLLLIFLILKDLPRCRNTLLTKYRKFTACRV